MTDIEDDDGETFVGVDMQWALSTRTRIAATYGVVFMVNRHQRILATIPNTYEPRSAIRKTLQTLLAC